jgi:hypothetical protein
MAGGALPVSLLGDAAGETNIGDYSMNSHFYSKDIMFKTGLV